MFFTVFCSFSVVFAACFFKQKFDFGFYFAMRFVAFAFKKIVVGTKY